MYQGDRVTYFAETDFRNSRTPFGIKASDRTRHMYVIGKTGMGKSTLLENMAIQDIQNGEGVAFIDPHGGTAEKLLSYIPPERISDVVYFAPFDLDHPIAFNIMEDVGYDKRHLVANGLMSAFKKIWVDAWSARMEYILNNCLLALLEYPESTLLSVNRMLVDKSYRKDVVENISDPSVKAFWTEEFAKYTDRYTQEATPAIQNKIGQFTANPLIRNIVGQPHSSFDIRKIMDEKKILIMNLSKGRMGEQNANLIGSMLVTKIYLAAMSRADLRSHELAELPNFYFYVDEFQSFANESFADILSEARKYKLNLTIAHQYVEQMPEEVRAAVFGNVGTMITFRIGSYDAEIFEKEFAPRFTSQDIVNLGFAQIYLRLMIDGVGSQPFSAHTLPPIELPDQTFHDNIVEESRRNYSAPREVVENQIREWHETPIRKKAEVTEAPRDPGGSHQNGRQERNVEYRYGNMSPTRNGSDGAQKQTPYPPFQDSHPREARQTERRNTDRRLRDRRGSRPNDRRGDQRETGRSLSEHHTEREETISLSSLGKKKTKRAENPLKKALADAIALREDEQHEERKSIPKSEQTRERHPSKPNSNKAPSAKDFPEDTFKAILDGDERHVQKDT